MNITDPILIVILLVSHAFLTGLGYCIGSAIRDERAKRELQEHWKASQKLLDARTILDLRDDSPLT